MIPRSLLIVMAAGFFASRFDGGAALDPAPVAAGPAAAMAGTGNTASGVIAGKVTFSGTAPPPQSIRLSADPKCAAIHKGGLQYQPVKLKNGGLADVLVYVKSGIGASYPAPAEPFVIDQVGCQYSPTMVAVMVGQPLRIQNSDDTLHNIHPRPTANKEFNVGQPRKGMVVTKTFEKPELMIPIGCDVHPWMRAHLSVLAHPFFAVTKEDGSYEIRGLPDGEYEVEAVHGQLKSVTARVTLKDGQASPLNFTLKG